MPGRMIHFFCFIAIASLAAILTGCAKTAEEAAIKIDDSIPHTDKPFLDNPHDFHFVVLGDRTGGHRPGVFERAMDQVNLLQPEFVMCVGDLIEGYTEDRDRLDHEWTEIESMVDKLQMPFFYTVGNHDMSNELMRQQWGARLGRDYYHFVYKGVLFISLNTEDPPVMISEEYRVRQSELEQMMAKDPVGTQQLILEHSRNSPQAAPLPGQVAISDKQVSYVERVLSDNRDVRWTFIFMHKPAWIYQDNQFARIEAMLGDRPYTVVAGHEHYYAYTRRYGRDYIDMATSGGIWLRDGPGRLDHVAWVTMTANGPVFANIRLDGITDQRGLP